MENMASRALRKWQKFDWNRPVPPWFHVVWLFACLCLLFASAEGIKRYSDATRKAAVRSLTPPECNINSLELAIESRNPQWGSVRDVFIANHPDCCYCGRPAEEAHHVWPVHLRPEWELDTANLRAVCRECHFIHGHLQNWKAFNPLIDSDCERHKVEIKHKPFTESDVAAFEQQFATAP